VFVRRKWSGNSFRILPLTEVTVEGTFVNVPCNLFMLEECRFPDVISQTSKTINFIHFLTAKIETSRCIKSSKKTDPLICGLLELKMPAVYCKMF
jgi:hypothetical protein